MPPGLRRGGMCGSFAPRGQRENAPEGSSHGFGQCPDFTGLTGRRTDTQGGEARLTRQTRCHTQCTHVRGRRAGADTPRPSVRLGQGRAAASSAVPPRWGGPVSAPTPRLRCTPLPPGPRSTPWPGIQTCRHTWQYEPGSLDSGQGERGPTAAALTLHLRSPAYGHGEHWSTRLLSVPRGGGRAGSGGWGAHARPHS